MPRYPIELTSRQGLVVPDHASAQMSASHRPRRRPKQVLTFAVVMTVMIAFGGLVAEASSSASSQPIRVCSKHGVLYARPSKGCAKGYTNVTLATIPAPVAGPRGATGAKGATGATGPAGAQGAKGQTGGLSAVYYDHPSAWATVAANTTVVVSQISPPAGTYLVAASASMAYDIQGYGYAAVCAITDTANPVFVNGDIAQALDEEDVGVVTSEIAYYRPSVRFSVPVTYDGAAPIELVCAHNPGANQYPYTVQDAHLYAVAVGSIN